MNMAGRSSNRNASPQPKACPGVAENLDVVRDEREIEHEKHNTRNKPYDFLRRIALFPGQRIELVHAAHEQHRERAPKLHCDQTIAPSTTAARTRPLSVRTTRFLLVSFIS